jgi:alpha-galactosidase
MNGDLPPVIRLDRGEITLIFDLRRGQPELGYCGGSLPLAEDALAICDAQRRGPHESQPDEPVPASIFPQSGGGYPGGAAIEIVVDGMAASTDLRLTDVQVEAHGVGFTLQDARIRADVRWTITPSGMVESTTCVTNAGCVPLTLVSLASLALPLPRWATELTRFSGRWAGEMHEERLALPHGQIGGASLGGRPGFAGSNWVRLEAPGASEAHGRAIAAHLAWSGDHVTSIERSAEGDAMLLMSARLEPGEIVLAPGGSFAAPRGVFTVSDHGRSGLRRAFHREVAAHAPATGPRKVHLNSWEALGFDLSLPALKRLADDAGALGVERFVLDDGWFEGRRNGTSSLGDWTPDRTLFPDGLTPLIDHVHHLGMDFGLWVEPEMISPDSALYRAHPDWCLHVEGMRRVTQRRQLVLDLTQTEVSEHLFAAIDALLRENAIAYLKWDHNRDLFPTGGKSHAQTLALYALLDRLRAAHPGVEIESCASGGGRVDLEILRRCGRYWASDNNDAIERLRINRGWFQFLPLSVTGNHVGPSPNPITGRRLAMDFRAKVAMFGHMGVEADPAAMNERERATLGEHIALYKDWRSVLHAGALSEIACADPAVFGWLALHGREGLALAANTGFGADYNAPPVRLVGLARHAFYRVRLLEPWPRRSARYLPQPEQWRDGLVLSGAALAEIGLALPLTLPETAWLIALEQVA